MWVNTSSAQGGTALALPADLANSRATGGQWSEPSSAPVLDVVVYAAGTNLPQRALAVLQPAAWDDLLAVNLERRLSRHPGGPPGDARPGRWSADLHLVRGRSETGRLGRGLPGDETRPGRPGPRHT